MKLRILLYMISDIFSHKIKTNSSDNKSKEESKPKNISTLEGQKQLLDLGKQIQNLENIETLRKEKIRSIDTYILQNIRIELPEGIKNDNYSNSVRNIMEINKDKIISIKNDDIKPDESGLIFGLSTKKIDEEKIKNDIINLYYGYRLNKYFIKKLESKLDEEKKFFKDLQQSYIDVSKESVVNEEYIDKLEKKLNDGLKLGTGLISLLSFLNVIFYYYIYKGPVKLNNDFYNLFISIVNFVISIYNIFNFTVDIVFGIPNILKVSIIFLGYWSYHNYDYVISKKIEFFKSIEGWKNNNQYVESICESLNRKYELVIEKYEYLKSLTSVEKSD